MAVRLFTFKTIRRWFSMLFRSKATTIWVADASELTARFFRSWSPWPSLAASILSSLLSPCPTPFLYLLVARYLCHYRRQRKKNISVHYRNIIRNTALQFLYRRKVDEARQVKRSWFLRNVDFSHFRHQGFAWKFLRFSARRAQWSWNYFVDYLFLNKDICV